MSRSYAEYEQRQAHQAAVSEFACVECGFRRNGAQHPRVRCPKSGRCGECGALWPCGDHGPGGQLTIPLNTPAP